MSTVQATNLKNGNSVSNNIVLDASGNAAFAASVTVAGNATITGTLQANGVTGTIYPLVLGSAQASTSGTSIDFTGIPSWARRVTVMFNGVSTNGTSLLLIQIGSGSIVTTGYLSAGSSIGAASAATTTSTAGFVSGNFNAAGGVLSGSVVLNNISGNIWVSNGTLYLTTVPQTNFTAGNSPALAGALDRVRITTVGGTDLFDAGSINLLWE